MNIRETWTSLSDEPVTCIACGETVARSRAREYDKHGDRWDREYKNFEYLCKPCHGECCHQNRDGLEWALVRAGAGRTDRKTFLRRYDEEVSGGNPTEHNSTR